jgi:hypothetical protein
LQGKLFENAMQFRNNCGVAGITEIIRVESNSRKKEIVPFIGNCLTFEYLLDLKGMSEEEREACNTNIGFIHLGACCVYKVTVLD